MQQRNKIVLWLNSCLVLICLLVVVGGITRLTDSGLSMVDWKPIMGIIPPISESEWQDSFSKYKKSAEFENYHSYFKLEDYKKIFYWEFFHRMLGRLIGVLFLFPFIYFKSKKYFNDSQFKRLLSIFILICVQGLIGWIMVRSGLMGTGDVSPYKLAIHLGFAMIILGWIYWIKLEFKYGDKYIDKIKNKLINNILLLLFVQLILGAITAGYEVGRDFLSSYSLLHDIVSRLPYFIQFLHIIVGLIFLIKVLFFAKGMTENKRIFKYSNLLSYVVLFQFFVGLINIISAVPFSIALIHQFLVIIILFLSIKIKYLLQTDYIPS